MCNCIVHYVPQVLSEYGARSKTLSINFRPVHKVIWLANDHAHLLGSNIELVPHICRGVGDPFCKLFAWVDYYYLHCRDRVAQELGGTQYSGRTTSNDNYCFRTSYQLAKVSSISSASS